MKTLRGGQNPLAASDVIEGRLIDVALRALELAATWCSTSVCGVARHLAHHPGPWTFRFRIGHRNIRNLGLGRVLTPGSARTDGDVPGCLNTDSADISEVVREDVVHVLRVYRQFLADEDRDLGVVFVDWSAGTEQTNGIFTIHDSTDGQEVRRRHRCRIAYIDRFYQQRAIARHRLDQRSAD